MDTIFTIRKELIGALAARPAVSLFRDLLWAESRSIGIPINKIQITLWIDVSDGGIDASIEENAADLVRSSGLIKAGNTGYQIKTGTTFRPWQDSAIKNELFGGKEPSKENLGESVRACLDKKGTYILVCFGHDFTDDQHRQAIDALKLYFKQCKYKQPKVEVWGQSTLIGYLKAFPSLILQLQGFDQSRFQTHKSWSRNDDMEKEFVAGKAQEDFVRDVQEALRKSDQAVHVRICGEPGVGKTRLVLETTSAADLSPLVIYCDSPAKFIDSVLLNEFLKEDNYFSFILVIDECDPGNKSYIWNKLKPLGKRCKLVTIYNENDATPGNTLYLDAPPLETEQISAIIQEYGIQKLQAHRWSELCSGSPRVAHVIGWNLRNNPEDILKPLDTINIWERYIVGSDNPQDEDVKQRKVILQHLALFKRFGYEKEVVAEAKALASLIEQADRQITWAKFQRIIKQLRDRKILQGQSTLYITPKALHIRLWLDWWDIYRAGFDFEAFSADLPDSLKQWFFEMFRYARESRAASSIVEELLGKNGPFQKDDALKTKLGSDFFLALTEANPEAALRCLQNTIGTWGKDELIQFGEGRRSVVWALERIVVWKPLFKDAARLLLRLGEAENETYSNNASGVFADLFSHGAGAVAPTEASPEERFPVLKEAINSQSKEIRLIAIKACDRALETRSFWRTVGPEQQGLREAKLWQPESRDEVMQSYRRVWQLLSKKIADLQLEERNEAIKVLVRHARSLTHYPELADLVIDEISDLSEKPYGDKDQVVSIVERILHYDRKSLPIPIAERWKQLRDALVSDDFPSLMRRYVSMDLIEDRVNEEGKFTDKTEQPIKNLAQQVIDDIKIIEPELPWLVTNEANNGFRFGYELGKKDIDLSLFSVLVAAQRNAKGDNASDLFLGGYFRALFERNLEHWEEILDDLSKDTQMARWVAHLTWRSGMTDRAALRILKLVQTDELQPWHFRLFGLGSAISDLSEDILLQWLELLLSRPEDYAASIALDLHHFYYGRKESKHTMPKELTLRLLTHSSLFEAPQDGRRDQMDDFHWKEIGNKFVELYPEASIGLLEPALEHFRYSQTPDILTTSSFCFRSVR